MKTDMRRGEGWTRRGALGLLAACLVSPAAMAATTLRIGIMAGEDETLWQTIAKNLEPSGLAVKVVVFSDYTQPNEALAQGELDANAFQHTPYLQAQITARAYKIAPVGWTYVAPIGLYSRKHRDVAGLPDGARIGVPNDPSNEVRALKLLAAQGLIALRDTAGQLATALDIIDSARRVRIVELDAGIVGRSIDDLDAAVVNTDWALKAGIDVKHERIAVEAVDGNPYRNLIAVSADRKDEPWVKTLVDAYHQDNVRSEILRLYKGALLPAW